jgi:hypothetical protein
MKASGFTDNCFPETLLVDWITEATVLTALVSRQVTAYTYSSFFYGVVVETTSTIGSRLCFTISLGLTDVLNVHGILLTG